MAESLGECVLAAGWLRAHAGGGDDEGDECGPGATQAMGPSTEAASADRTMKRCWSPRVTSSLMEFLFVVCLEQEA